MNAPIADPSSTVDPSQWVDQYGDYLFRFAMSRLRDANAAEEVVQDTFVAALKNVEQFSGKGSEKSWLSSILKNKIVDVFRSRNRGAKHMAEDGPDIADMLFDENGSWKKQIRSAIRNGMDSIDRQEFWQVFRGCLSGLPQKQGDVFAMRVMDDRDSEEICKEMEVSSSNLWVILHRARVALSSCMKQTWFQEGN